MGRASNVISGNGFISQTLRRARLALLSNIVRPFVHFREGETITFAEKQADLALSRLARRAMAHTGLQSRHVCTSFGVMHCYDSAPGSSEPPLVMIHGIGSSGQCFLMLAEAIKKYRRVVLPDLFHFSGFSVPNNPVMNLDEHTRSIEELMDGLGVSECDAVGLSLGGWIAQKCVLRQSVKVRRLMLLNSAGLRFGTIVLRDKLLTLSWEKFDKLFPGLLYAPPYRGVQLVSPVVRRALFRLLKDHAVRDFMKTIRPSDFMEPYLSQIKCPVLLLWGDRDSFLSQQAPHFFVRHLPDVQGFYVEDCAHILCLEAPYNCLEHMDEFFALDMDRQALLPVVLSRAFGRYQERSVTSQLYSVPVPETQEHGYRLSG